MKKIAFMWDEKCLAKVSKIKISLYWIFYTKIGFFTRKDTCFRLFYLLTHKKDKYIIIKRCFISQIKLFSRKKGFVCDICDANEKREKQKTKRVLPFGGSNRKKRKSNATHRTVGVQYDEENIMFLKKPFAALAAVTVIGLAGLRCWVPMMQQRGGHSNQIKRVS